VKTSCERQEFDELWVLKGNNRDLVAALPRRERFSGLLWLARALRRRFDNHQGMLSPTRAESSLRVPRIPASAGALIFDKAGRLLILKPNYKAGWTIPGGQIEETGESPWEGCRRETFEECGLTIKRGRLACVDFLRPRPGRPGGVRFLFDCGHFGGKRLAAISIDRTEIDEHRFAGSAEAAMRLSGPVRRRVLAATGGKRCVYVEEGRRVKEVRS
jgi:8-oxo-dGTP pyrophosphatase MutT (NUDIX family)